MMFRTTLARIAGAFYALNVVLGIVGLMWARQGRAGAVQMQIAGAFEYAIVVLLLGKLFEPAGRALSWGVAAYGVLACAITAAVSLRLLAPPFNAIAVFGPYCIGLGIVVVRSRLMPQLVGWLLILGGTSWLTFALPQLSHQLGPWNTVAGGLPEVIFTLWLLIFAVRATDRVR